MERFEVNILGCGCAVPTTRHNQAAQMINVRGKLSLVDCGEGTQLQMRYSHLHFMSVRNVFISHLHGDHCFGIPGLISSFGLLGRPTALHIYAPQSYGATLELILERFCPNLSYDVVFHGFDTTQRAVIYDDRSVSVETVPLDHSVPCCGFLFKEKPTLPHILRDMIDYYQIPVSQINNIKNGADWTLEDGTIIPNDRLTTPAAPPRSYAYLSDTAFKPDNVEQLRGVTMMYHEATYGNDRLERARLYRHSTAAQAAEMARLCEAKKLLIGHYSANYPDESVLLKEAQAIFPATIAANEGMKIAIE